MHYDERAGIARRSAILIAERFLNRRMLGQRLVFGEVAGEDGKLSQRGQPSLQCGQRWRFAHIARLHALLARRLGEAPALAALERGHAALAELSVFASDFTEDQPLP